MYCALSDIQKTEPAEQIVQLTDDVGSGAVGAENLAQAIELAAGYIDAKLRGHVTLPLPEPVPGIVVQIAVELSVWNLYKRRMGSNMPESIIERRKWAEARLDEIVSGTLILAVAGQPVAAAAPVRYAARRKVFSPEELDRY
jgi:phage gp36-like protein